MKTDLKALVSWLAGLVVLGGAAWGSWVTTTIAEQEDAIITLLQSVARIETKVDILLDEKTKKQ